MKKPVFFLFLIFCFYQQIRAQNISMPLQGTQIYYADAGMITDPGQLNNYSNNTVSRVTLYPQTSGFVKLNFTSFQLTGCCDVLKIYNGADITSPLIGTWSSNSSPGIVYSTDTSGALTIELVTDSAGTAPGFIAILNKTISPVLPDLVIDSVKADVVTVYPNTSFVIGARILVADGNFNDSVTVKAFFSRDETIDSADILLNTFHTFLTNSNWVQANVKLPLTDEGPGYIIYIADPVAGIVEQNALNNQNDAVILVGFPQTDVAGFSFNFNTQAVTNQIINHTYVIRNNGNVNVDSVRIDTYYSVDTLFDTNDVLLNQNYMPVISANNSYTYAKVILLPASILAGEAYIIAITDAGNRYVEYNEANNITVNAVNIISATIHQDLFPLTDTIVFAAPSFFQKLYPGKSINVSYSFYNHGSQLQWAPLSVGAYLSTDTLFDGSDVLLGSQNVTNIQGNSVNTLAFNGLVIPTSTIQGNYYLLIVVDNNNIFVEIDELNNNQYFKVEITPPYTDLSLSPNKPINYINPKDSQVFFSWNVTNSGNLTSAASKTGVYLSTDSVFSINDIFLAASAAFSYGLNSTSISNVTYNIPANFPFAEGIYYVIGVIDYQNAVTEANETNNTSFIKVIVEKPLPDIEVSGLSYLTSSLTGKHVYHQGDSIRFNASIKNSGNKTAGSFMTRFYISSDMGYDISDILIASLFLDSLNIGGGTSIVVNAVIPASLNSGNNYIVAVADPQNDLREIREDNNYNYFPVAIGPYNSNTYIIPASGTQNISTSGGSFFDNGGLAGNYSDNCNGSITFYSLVTTARIAVSIFNTVLSAGDTIIVYNGPSAAYPVLQKIYINLNRHSGSFDFTSNNPNNALTVKFKSNGSITRKGFEGLVMQIGRTSKDIMLVENSSVLSNPSFKYTNNTGPGVTIYNTGSNINSGFINNLYFSNDTSFSANDLLLSSITPGSLCSGCLNGFNYPLIPINDTIAPGTYYLINMIDKSNVVTELYENNNNAVYEIKVIPKLQDIRPSIALTNSNIPQNDSLSFKLTVDQISHNFVSNFQVGYFISADEKIDSLDIPLGVFSETIGSQTFQNNFSRKIPIPVGLGQGRYFLLSHLDIYNTIPEVNDSNNTNWISFNITAPAFPVRDLQIIKGWSNAKPYNTLSRGSRVNFISTVLNHFPVAVNYNSVKLYFSIDSLWDSGDELLTATNGNNLGPNDTYPVNLFDSIPLNAPFGMNYLILYVDPLNVVKESNELNNFSILPVFVADSSVSINVKGSAINKSGVLPGTAINFYTGINNYGNYTIPSLPLKYFFSNDSIRDASDTLLLSTSMSGNGIGTNYSNYYYQTIIIPSNAPAGKRYVFLIADVGLTLPDSVRHDNLVMAQVNILSADPALQIGSLHASESTMPSMLSFRITNVGYVPASGAQYSLALSVDTVIDPSDFLLYSDTVNTIPVNSSYYYTYLLDTTFSSPNQYHVLLSVDFPSLNANLNNKSSTNNEPLRYLTLFKNDTTVSVVNGFAFSFKDSVLTTDTLNVFGGIFNFSGKIQEGNVSFYLSNDTVLDVADNLLFTDSLSINTMSEVLKNFNFNLAGNFNTGNWNLISKVSGVLSDIETLDNIYHSPLFIYYNCINPVITINPLSKTKCEDDTVVFMTVANGSNLTYQWFKGSLLINGANSSSFIVNNISLQDSGLYYSKISNGCGFVYSDTANLIVNAKPNPIILANDIINFCQGDSVSIILSDAMSFNNYTWNTGSSDSTILVNSSGEYLVLVTDTNGCSNSSNTINVTVNTLPTISIITNNSLEFCESDSVQLQASSQSANSFVWNTGETTNLILVEATGVYYVEVSDSNGCIGRSDTVNVVVHSLPASPTIIQIYDTLHSSVGVSYQWFDINGEITGATNNYYIPFQEGIYWIEIGDSNGCTSFSEGFNFALTFADLQEDQHLKKVLVSPNPAQAEVNIKLLGMRGSNVQIDLRSSIGARVYSDFLMVNDNILILPVEISNLANGIYFLTIISNDDIPMTVKIVKN